MVRVRWPWVWAGLMVAVLGISAVSYVLTPRRLEPRVLFFPGAQAASIDTELHFLPKGDQQAVRVRQLVEAALAGPLSLQYSRLAPAGSRLLGVFLRDHTVYVNLDGQFQNAATDCPLPPRERLSLLDKSIKYNETGIEKIVFLIDGKAVTR